MKRWLATLISALSLSACAKLPMFPFAPQVDRKQAESVRVWDPYEKKEMTFTGVPAEQVFDSLWGKDWRSADEILITCLDGYQPILPVERFLKHRAWFAFESPDAPGFRIPKPESLKETVSLGPAYLVWENLQDQKVRAEGDYGWPFQVSKLELVKLKERFAKILPPENANASVRQGFQHFRVHCLKCHTVNGQGGQVGPELNYPVNVTEFLSRAHLRRWIAQPSAIRWGTKMPPLEVPKRDAVIESILDYLDSMRSRKIAPR